MYINLKNETLEILSEYGKTWDDVEWVGTRDKIIDKDKFLILADVEYDNGYGGTEVNTNLLVVGKDFWVERAEYDGSEWWEFKQLPKKPCLLLDSKNDILRC